jgi:hypothetical protein
MNKGIDLFEDYTNIPPNVQTILDKHQNDFESGSYEGLNKALKKLEKIGYTFEYYLDGVAYDLRPIGTMGKVESDIIH